LGRKIGLFNGPGGRTRHHYKTSRPRFVATLVAVLRNRNFCLVVLQQAVTVCDVSVCLFSQCCHALSAHFRPKNAGEKGVSAVIYKVRTKKKYPFKRMSPGESFKLNEMDVRKAQKAAYYYRCLCKRPISIVITKQDDGYYCRRVA
jgi:hypothetical protein